MIILVSTNPTGTGCGVNNRVKDPRVLVETEPPLEGL